MSSSSKSSSKTKSSTKSTNKTQTASQQINNYDSVTEDYRMLLMNYDPQKNTTRPIMSKYEKAFVLGKRATMLSKGAEPLIDVPEGETDVVAIAEEELNKKLTPFIIERDLGNGKKEIWKIKDMIINLD